MEQKKEDESFEIKKSKTNLPIPVVNGVHIHSAYDPIKEAKKMIRKDLSEFQRKKNILIFGYGFGYHVREIISFFKEKNVKKFKLIVIEKNEKLLSSALELFPNESNNLKVFCEKEPSNLFKNKDFLNFLINKPVIFAHPPSFSLYDSYFQKILKYKSPNSTSDLIENLESADLKSFFERNLDQNSLNDILNKINNKKSFTDKNEFLMSAFCQISKKPKKDSGVEYE